MSREKLQTLRKKEFAILFPVLQSRADPMEQFGMVHMEDRQLSCRLKI